MILHIPHSSTVIPAELRKDILLDDETLALELLRMTDHYTDELFTQDFRPNDSDVVFPVSRLVVDVERFENDAEEAMAQRGMGVIYTATSALTPLRASPSSEQRQVLLDLYYTPHHKQLTKCVERELAHAANRAFILDCHSFPSKALPYEDDQSLARPDFCIGTDPFHTPEPLGEWVSLAIQSLGFSAALNTPFAGALVSTKHFHEEDKVLALMIEVNRGLYMNERSGERAERFEDIKGVLGRIVRALKGGVEGAHFLRGICVEFGQFLAGHEAGFRGDIGYATALELYRVFGQILCLTKDPNGYEDVVVHNTVADALGDDDYKNAAEAGNVIIDRQLREYRLNDTEIERYRDKLENSLQSWLGYDIPAEGTEDHDNWIGMVLDIKDLKTCGDVIDYVCTRSGEDDAAALAL